MQINYTFYATLLAIKVRLVIYIKVCKMKSMLKVMTKPKLRIRVRPGFLMNKRGVNGPKT